MKGDNHGDDVGKDGVVVYDQVVGSQIFLETKNLLIYDYEDSMY